MTDEEKAKADAEAKAKVGKAKKQKTWDVFCNGHAGTVDADNAEAAKAAYMEKYGIIETVHQIQVELVEGE